MFVAAALLMFGLPQSVPGASTDSAATPVKTEIVKEDAAPSSALPAAPTSKVAADDVVPAPGESPDKLPAAPAAMVPGRREAVIREQLVRRSAESLTNAEERARQADRLRDTWRLWTTTSVPSGVRCT